MLIEMSMKIGNKTVVNDVREMAARKASRQQQRILLQISTVALIFYAYMTVYYISYYSRYFESSSTVIFNSFFYSFTHMINPVIYFSLNLEMRSQLRATLVNFIPGVWSERVERSKLSQTSKLANCQIDTRAEDAKQCHSFSESSPLFSSTNAYSTCLQSRQQENNPTYSAAESLEVKAVIEEDILDSDVYETPAATLDVESIFSRRSSSIMNRLAKAIRSSGSSSTNLAITTQSQIKNRFMKMSATLQLIGREPEAFTKSKNYLSLSDLERCSDYEEECLNPVNPTTSMVFDQDPFRTETEETPLFNCEFSDTEDKSALL